MWRTGVFQSGRPLVSQLDLERLSRFLSYVLRHRPDKFGLALDDEGFLLISNLLTAIQKLDHWKWVSHEHIALLLEKSGKKRFEIQGTKIRTIYGHSYGSAIEYKKTVPPMYLFHGTARSSRAGIEQRGLVPMKRKYVHLSTSFDDAFRVGLRRDSKPLVYKVSALRAHEEGVEFFRAGDLFLAKTIPRKYLEQM